MEIVLGILAIGVVTQGVIIYRMWRMLQLKQGFITTLKENAKKNPKTKSPLEVFAETAMGKSLVENVKLPGEGKDDEWVEVIDD